MYRPRAARLGACAADPLLAGDIGGPAPRADPDLTRNTKIRFTFTTEAGLDDGLAMPFVVIVLTPAGQAHAGHGDHPAPPVPRRGLGGPGTHVIACATK
ncbi:hypothetical protein [Amycolatopsis sp. NPDC051372]|uniref:hypothetical protein n=1 Tax=unclassified Amycolatopsis TaxID=2618356 RepID=UPI003420CCDB